MGTLNTVVAMVYLMATVAFVLGLHYMNSPATARRGNQLSSAGMIAAVGHGYAGIDNELYTDPKTGMFFADAKEGLSEITAAIKTLVAG